MTTAPDRYDWLRCHHLRRSSLQWVERGIRAGRYDGDGNADRRAELVAVLTELLDGDDLTAREGVRVARIFAAIGERDLAIQKQHERESAVHVRLSAKSPKITANGQAAGLGDAPDGPCGPGSAESAPPGRARARPHRSTARVGSAR